MKGERLFVERQTELLEHLAEERDITIKFKLAFLKCFSPLGRDLEEACQDLAMIIVRAIVIYRRASLPRLIAMQRRVLAETMIKAQDFGIAVSTGYLWLHTWNDAGYAGISDKG